MPEFAEPHKSSIGGMNANLVALLSYISVVILSFIPGISYASFLPPLIIFLIEKDSEFVRFHAMQVLVLGLLGVIFTLLITIVGGIVTAAAITANSGAALLGGFGLFALISGAVGIVFAVFEIIACVGAWNYKYKKVPIAGNLAEKWRNLGRG